MLVLMSLPVCCRVLQLTPGDLGFDPLGFSDNGINPDYALSEIKHARLAVSPLPFSHRMHLEQSRHGVSTRY